MNQEMEAIMILVSKQDSNLTSPEEDVIIEVWKSKCLANRFLLHSPHSEEDSENEGIGNFMAQYYYLCEMDDDPHTDAEILALFERLERDENS